MAVKDYASPLWGPYRMHRARGNEKSCRERCQVPHGQVLHTVLQRPAGAFSGMPWSRWMCCMLKYWHNARCEQDIPIFVGPAVVRPRRGKVVVVVVVVLVFRTVRSNSENCPNIHFPCFTDPHNHTYSESSRHVLSTDPPTTPNITL